MAPLFALTGGALATGVGMGCSTTTSSSGTAPAAVTCSRSTSAADASSARAALAAASPGSCVVLTAATYAGPLTVPAGAALVAQDGSRVTISGGTAQEPAVSLGEGSQLANVDVVGSGGVGIAVRASNALLSSVTVSGAKGAALAILCKADATPSCASGTIALNGVQLSKSSLGLWVSGAHVAMKGGGSGSHAGTSLASAAGVIGQDGARLELDGVTVEKNEGVGILVDGASTTASIKNGTVSENGERGVWAQRVAGTLDAPSLRIEGTAITKNRIVGVGAVESHGIIIVSGRIAETVAAPLVTNLASTEQVGDGVGLFTSGDFKLDGTLLEANARAAGISDGSDRGIIIVSGRVGAGPSGLKFVVQNTKGADVQVADTDRSVPGAALGFSAPKLALPPVL
jgi:hypothetical protein